MTAPSTLIFASFLAQNMFKTYHHITDYIEQYVGIPTCLISGESLDDFAEGFIDGGFLCGLAYIELAYQKPCPVELVAAPILSGERYQDRPLYFSDVVVRADSTIHTFEELADCVWAYNEKVSHSGFNLVHYTLLEKGLSSRYFHQTIETGSHLGSLRLVLEGKADAAAIDSHMLDVVLLNSPHLRSQLRVVSSLGPSTIPPVVVAKHLDTDLQEKIRMALLTMHQDSELAQKLGEGVIKQFIPIADENYHDIRTMYHTVQENRNTILHNDVVVSR